mgnify:FL=1
MRIVAFMLLLSVLPVAQSGEIYNVDMAFDLNNRIVLPYAYKDLIIDFPAKIETIAIKDGRELLVRPKAGAKKTFILTFVLSNDDVFQLLVKHSIKSEPTVWRYLDATDDQGSEYLTLNDKNLWVSKVMVDAHEYIYGSDKITQGLSLGEKLKPWVMTVIGNGVENTISLKPLFAWIGMKKRLEAYRVVSESTMKVENQDFYRSDDVAIALESDVIGPKFSPYLIILREDK